MSIAQEHPGLTLIARLILVLLGILCLLYTIPQILVEGAATPLSYWLGSALGVALCVSAIFEKPAGVVVTLVLLATP
jgi:hypothetical protein